VIQLHQLSTYEPKTIVFNHREGVYTGLNGSLKLWMNYGERQDFQVWTSLKDMNKPYTKYIGHADRDVYMNQIV
jgi:hypothetical protein